MELSNQDGAYQMDDCYLPSQSVATVAVTGNDGDLLKRGLRASHWNIRQAILFKVTLASPARQKPHPFRWRTTSLLCSPNLHNTVSVYQYNLLRNYHNQDSYINVFLLGNSTWRHQGRLTESAGQNNDVGARSRYLEHISRAWISNYIPQYSVGCNYFAML